MSAFVYILRCADDSYYIGSTRSSLEERITKHDSGYFAGYTLKRRPVTLVWHQHFDRITDAIAAERQLKGWSRAKKEALIRGDFEALRELADGWRSRFGVSPRILRHARCASKLRMRGVLQAQPHLP